MPDVYDRIVEETVARLPLIPTQHVVDRLSAIVDRQAIERERMRLVLRKLLTEPMADAIGPVFALAREMNSDL